MRIYLKHLNTFRDTYDIARDYPFQWARVYVPDGHEIAPNLYENYTILCDRFQKNAYLHIYNEEYLGTLEELEPILLSWLQSEGIAQTRLIATQKEILHVQH
jgi:hypothetical protein